MNGPGLRTAPTSPACVVCALVAVPEIRSAPGPAAAASAALLVLGVAEACESNEIEIASVTECLCGPHALAYRGGVAELGAQLAGRR